MAERFSIKEEKEEKYRGNNKMRVRVQESNEHRPFVQIKSNFNKISLLFNSKSHISPIWKSPHPSFSCSCAPCNFPLFKKSHYFAVAVKVASPYNNIILISTYTCIYWIRHIIIRQNTNSHLNNTSAWGIFIFVEFEFVFLLC